MGEVIPGALPKGKAGEVILLPRPKDKRGKKMVGAIAQGHTWGSPYKDETEALAREYLERKAVKPPDKGVQKK